MILISTTTKAQTYLGITGNYSKEIYMGGVEFHNNYIYVDISTGFYNKTIKGNISHKEYKTNLINTSIGYKLKLFRNFCDCRYARGTIYTFTPLVGINYKEINTRVSRCNTNTNTFIKKYFFTVGARLGIDRTHLSYGINYKLIEDYNFIGFNIGIKL